jgi:hypothetical protein
VVRGTVSEIHNSVPSCASEGIPPICPGIGFIRIPELTWEHFDDPADVVYVGQQIDEPLAPDPFLESG